ncbi:hypothetical protein PR202_gb23670 [Eleusine coracana subsp. coracana]|uniref:VWFA domain-containing protein n=1 Tax=Eleusine coracana subsp. coracana TaxID=191504 RepID=A0AAV5FJ76_ELECO|nr:hypothetical protein PR202_gb23670 [Eleusine coracana subsp. coracana]
MNPPILLVDDRHKLRLNGTAVVRVQAPLSVKTCAPIDLVALINVGNSMNWTEASLAETPSRLDLVKKAMKFIIRQLEDDDRLAIVAFNDQVIKEHTIGISEISGGNRMAMEQKVDDLMAKGDTAFKPSLEHAVKLLDDRADKKRLGLIILISDGLDNSTFKWSDESAAPVDPIRNLLKKYPVHTFGLGKTHDPKALHFIAKESYGTYSSITDSIESKILEAFAVCLGGLKSIVAIDTSVEITSSSLSITRIDSGSYTPQGASGNILIGTLYAGEVRDFVVHFYYTTPGWTPGYYTILSGITANVTYKDVPRRQSTSTDRCSVSLPIHTAESGTTPANPCPPFPVVLQQMVRFKVLDFLISALKEFLVLKEETIGAIHGEEGDDLVLQVMGANLLQRKWKEFKQCDECWKEAPRSFLDLGGMDKDVTAMVNSLKRGLGYGCIYSWMSSYQMQRATVTGLPSHSVETRFRTPAMEAMVQQAMEAPVPGQDKEVCKHAVEILEMINRRFELWCKLDCDVPQGFQTSPEHEDDSEFRNLTAVLHGDISRAKQHDIYLAADHAIKLWRSSFTPEEKSHGRSLDK